MTASRQCLGLLLGVFALAGCGEQAAKPADSKQADAVPAAAKPAAEGPSGADIRRGVGNLLPSVQRGAAGLDLQNIAKMYAVELLAGNSPKKVEDFRGLDPRVVKAVKDGDYVVIWNVAPGTSLGAIIAYESEVPKQGGMAAKLDGSVARVTPAEFQASQATGR